MMSSSRHTLSASSTSSRTNASRLSRSICCATVGHARDVDERLELRLAVQLEGALADVHGHVADALQVGGDLEAGGDEAQIARRRLVQGQQAEAELVDLDVHAVDGVVALDGHVGELVVAVDRAP